jgi:hypothetical protein
MTGWLKVAPVRTRYTYFGDVQRRCPRAPDGHIRCDLRADRHRPKIQAVRAKGGLRMSTWDRMKKLGLYSKTGRRKWLTHP